MSGHEEVDLLEVDDNEPKLHRHVRKEDYQEEIQTEEDDERKDTEKEDEEPQEKDTSPLGDRHTLHAHDTSHAELEETNEIMEVDRDVQPTVQSTDGQPSLTNKVEDGKKTDGEKLPSGGHSDERKNEIKTTEKAKRDNWRQTKSLSEVKKANAVNGEGHHSTHGRNLTPAAPKKVADKVHSIIEDYTTKMKGASSRPEAADRTPVRVGSFRGSDSEPKSKGHISEIRARIERSASSVHGSRPPPRRSAGPGGARDAESIDERDNAALEAKRKKKAEDWLKKVKTTDPGSHGTPDRSGPLSPPGKSQTSTWKKRELELKKEREEKEAAQKQLEEKRKILDEERRARETARKLKEQDDAAKGEHSTTTTTPTTTTERHSLSHDKHNAKEVEKTSRSVQSPGVRSSPLLKSLSISSEDEKLKKQKAIEGRLRPFNIDGLDKDELANKAHELYERVRKLEEDKYDLEMMLEKRESELNELKVKTGDAKGKFVKPQLKKVLRKDEGATHKDDVSFSAQPKPDDDDDSKIQETTDEYLTRTTNSDESDAIGRQDTLAHHHDQPAMGQLLQTADC